MRRRACLLLLLPLVACRPARAPEHVSTDLVDRMIAHYARLTTYRDRGASMEWSARDDAAELSVTTTEFDTVFERSPVPRLRFDFKSAIADAPTTLVTRGPEVRIYDHGYEVTTIESLDEAQMRLRGTSAGTTDIVPSLLQGQNPWTCNGQKPTRSEIDGEDWVANVRCTRVVIHRPPCGDVYVCIDRNLLLRRASDWWRASADRQRKSLQDFIDAHPDHREVMAPRLAAMTSPTTDENTILFVPVVNAPIPADEFEVDAPEPPPTAPDTF